MSARFRLEFELPDDLERFQLPEAADDRLQHLLDVQDAGSPLTDAERREAEGPGEPRRTANVAATPRRTSLGMSGGFANFER